MGIAVLVMTLNNIYLTRNQDVMPRSDDVGPFHRVDHAHHLPKQAEDQVIDGEDQAYYSHIKL